MTAHPLKARAAHLWQQGHDTAEIARRLRVAESWVYHVLAHRRDRRAA